MPRFFIFVIFYFFTFSQTQAQFTTEGKEFWLGFPEFPYFSSQIITQQLFITSRYNTTGTVSIPRVGWSQNFTVGISETVIISLPPDSEVTNHEVVENKGIYVRANEDISVYAIHKKDYSTEASLVLPVQSLKNAYEYVVNTYVGSSGSSLASQSQFLVVAMENNTQIEITPSTNTFGGRLKGNTFSVQLDSGQVYQVQTYPVSFPESYDMSGSVVRTTNNKPFALFSGVGVTIIGCPAAAQHLVEQNYPVSVLGREYVLLPFAKASKGYIYKIVATEHNTQVQIKAGNSPTNLITLQKGEVYETNIVPPVDFENGIAVIANKPISISQYLKGRGCNGISPTNDRGDPCMLMLNAINQPVQKTVFNTVSTPTDALNSHYVNIITQTHNTDKIALQGSLLPSTLFKPITTYTGYSYAQVDLVPYGIDPVLGKSFTLESDSTFIAYAYGYGEASAYAYSVGANFIKLDYKFTASKEQVCLGEAITFQGDGTNILSYTWDFGDGSPTQTGQNVTHTYSQVGNYKVKMTVTIAGSPTSHRTTQDIEVYPLAIPDLGEDQTHCVGKGFVLDSKINIAGITYTWWRDGAVLPTAQSGTLQTDIAGTYIIEAKTDKGCSRKDTVVLAYYPTIQAQIINLLPEYFTDNAPVVLEGLPAGGVFTLNGSTVTELSPATMRVGKHKVVYAYQDVHGCIWKDSAMVQITNPAVRFFMPNSFTPNGDGLNDVLQIFGDNFLYLDVRIYNRWGEVVFATDNKEKMWNGTTGGKPAPAGVYYCTVEYTEPREKKRIKYQSYIQLIR